jgi:hypothetical protein
MRVMELHAPLRVVQRSKGRTATAAAAYRAAERIRCERTGDVHDYSRKRNVESTAILLPHEAPDWAHERSRLWNEAERREKHPRAQTAREVEIAFPVEFNARQRREAGLAIASFLVERHGVAVDVAWHKPGRKGDERNHHIHMLFTTRQFDENGEWAKSKARTLDDLYGGQGKEEVKALRLGIANVMNDIAARDRLDVYVEHESFEKRGLDREATQHMGPVANEIERQGRRSDIGEKNRAIEQRNAERQKLREQKKNIATELRRQDERLPTPPDYEKERVQFYRSTQDKRRQMLEHLETEHGEQQKNAQAEIVKRMRAIDNAGFFSRWFRFVTGRTKADMEAIAQHEQMLEAISAKRREAAATFEQQRMQELTRQQEVQRQQEAAYELALRRLQQEQYTRLPVEQQKQDTAISRDFTRSVQDEPPPLQVKVTRQEELERRLEESRHRKRGRSL